MNGITGQKAFKGVGSAFGMGAASGYFAGKDRRVQQAGKKVAALGQPVAQDQLDLADLDVMADQEMASLDANPTQGGPMLTEYRGDAFDATYYSPEFVGPRMGEDLGESFITFDGSTTKTYYHGQTNSYDSRSGVLDKNGNTQPSKQDVRNVGPIPKGEWSMAPAEISAFRDLTPGQQNLANRRLAAPGMWNGGIKSYGEYRVPIRPASGTNTFGRDAFFGHGGARFGSLGCIDFASNNNAFMSDFGWMGGRQRLFVRY